MRRRVSVARLWDETSEIRCFELRAVDGGKLPAIEPGAHIDVHLDGGLTRQYSLWNGPGDTEAYLIGVKRESESRGGSAAMHQITQGEILEVGNPRNNFPLAETTGPSLLLAGGIGITPLLSMMRFLDAQSRPVQLHLFSRSIDLSPFSTFLHDRPTATIHAGLFPPRLNAVLADLLECRQDNAHLYICGPVPFMDLARTTALEKAWPEPHIHLEYFAPRDDAAEPAGHEFELVLQKSGKTLVVRSDQTIIQAMTEAGVDILTSCEQGVCGTCVTTVIEGEPDHRDVYLNAVEHASGKIMTPCVSRCKGNRLVLDL